MTEFLFWLFMLAMALLIPGCMTVLGRSFVKNPPGEINGGYGYRTVHAEPGNLGVCPMLQRAVLVSSGPAYAGGFTCMDDPAVCQGSEYGGKFWPDFGRLAYGSVLVGYSGHGAGTETRV